MTDNENENVMETLQQDLKTAANSVNVWSGVATVMPLVGGFLADAYVGRRRYSMILFSAFLYVMASLILPPILPFFFPLYLHPSESVTSLGVEKLQGALDYRAWRRSMDISLAAKRKLGFATGAVKKDQEDAKKGEQWETCDSMVIAWIHASVSEQIKKSILYAKTSSEAWKQLEKTFNVVNGSRKYKVDK
ncbi:Protein NRT1/ PTR FAMILY 5.7 [Bienertia sinuspersici]